MQARCDGKFRIPIPDQHIRPIPTMQQLP